MTDNLALWHAVEKTPPEHTKAITGKAYQGTSPKPHYLIKTATETFGPCGIGWGFVIVSERIEDGAGGEKLHIAHVRVWYKWNGERGEVEHIGGTPFAGTRSSGKAFLDEDAPKKSVTDALVKALSMIGFAGDIFMGRYDDSNYVAELRQEAREQATSLKPVAVPPAKYDPEKSAEMRQELMTRMLKPVTRQNLRTWADMAKIRSAIERLTDKDASMFSAEYQKRWEALPESPAMAG